MITIDTKPADVVKAEIVSALEPHMADLFHFYCEYEANTSPSSDPCFEMTVAQAVHSPNFTLVISEYLSSAMHNGVQTEITWEEIESLQERVLLLEYLEG